MQKKGHEKKFTICHHQFYVLYAFKQFMALRNLTQHTPNFNLVPKKSLLLTPTKKGKLAFELKPFIFDHEHVTTLYILLNQHCVVASCCAIKTRACKSLFV